MNVLLLEIPSADHAFEGWLGGKAIREIFDMLGIEHTYKLILNKRYLYRSIRKNVDNYDFVHIECHSDEEGICYNPTGKDYITWETLGKRIAVGNDLEGIHLIMSGGLAGNIDSEEKLLASDEVGFKRVFAFDERIGYDKAVAVWSGFYYLLSNVKKWNFREVRSTVKKLRECYDVELLYFYPSRVTPEGVGVYPSRSKRK